MIAHLDQLTALIVGSVVFFLIVVLGFRMSQDRQDAVTNYMATTHAYGLTQILEHDLKNLRPASMSPPSLQFKCGIRNNALAAIQYTDMAQFMSIEGPGLSNVVMVQYEVVPSPSGDSLDTILEGNNGRYPLYDLVRSINDGTGLTETTRWSNILNFSMDLIRADGTVQTPPDPANPSYGCTENNPPVYTNLLGSIRIQLVTGMSLGDTDAREDRSNTSNLNIFHYSKIIRPMNLN